MNENHPCERVLNCYTKHLIWSGRGVFSCHWPCVIISNFILEQTGWKILDNVTIFSNLWGLHNFCINSVELKVICQLKIYKIQMDSASETHICRKFLQSGPKVLALQLARFRFNQRFWQSMSKEAGSGLPWSDSHSRTCTSFTKDWIGCKLCSKILKWKNDNRI